MITQPSPASSAASLAPVRTLAWNRRVAAFHPLAPGQSAFPRPPSPRLDVNVRPFFHRRRTGLPAHPPDLTRGPVVSLATSTSPLNNSIRPTCSSLAPRSQRLPRYPPASRPLVKPCRSSSSPRRARTAPCQVAMAILAHRVPFRVPARA
jgi:hypothetical protein